tara:strand:- start:258 stop:554 length:297 start_codon:yes stop_codon:yes gene_type:complete
MNLQAKDWKLTAILVLIIVIVGMGTWMGYGAFKARDVNIYTQGVQTGMLQEKANVIQSVQATGYYALNLVDAENNPQTVVLAPVMVPNQQQQTQQPGS